MKAKTEPIRVEKQKSVLTDVARVIGATLGTAVAKVRPLKALAGRAVPRNGRKVKRVKPRLGSGTGVQKGTVGRKRMLKGKPKA